MKFPTVLLVAPFVFLSCGATPRNKLRLLRGQRVLQEVDSSGTLGEPAREGQSEAGKPAGGKPAGGQPAGGPGPQGGAVGGKPAGQGQPKAPTTNAQGSNADEEEASSSDDTASSAPAVTSTTSSAGDGTTEEESSDDSASSSSVASAATTTGSSGSVGTKTESSQTVKSAGDNVYAGSDTSASAKSFRIDITFEEMPSESSWCTLFEDHGDDTKAAVFNMGLGAISGLTLSTTFVSMPAGKYFFVVVDEHGLKVGKLATYEMVDGQASLLVVEGASKSSAYNVEQYFSVTA